MANLHSSIAQIFHAHPHVLPQLAEAAREFPETPNIVKHSFNAISIISQSTKRHETLYRLGVPALATAACFRYSSHQAVLSALAKLNGAAELGLDAVLTVQSNAVAVAAADLDSSSSFSEGDSNSDDD